WVEPTMGLLWTFLAFALALGVLIVFHELGHYAVARAAGVKVLRFSVGFGTPLLVRRLGRDRTEWALSAFPLGGYVKMLDEREGPVAVEERHRAFNRQPVGKRFAIVLAGPLANFVLAVLLYWILYLHGVPGLRPLIGEAPAGSAAAAAQLAGGDEILRVGDKPVATWQDLRWELLDHAVRRDTVTLEVRGAKGDLKFPRLDLSRVRNEDIDKDLLAAIGLTRYTPPMRPVIGRLIEGGAGKRDGLQEGDLVLAIGGRPVEQWEQLVEAVRASPGKALS